MKVKDGSARVLVIPTKKGEWFADPSWGLLRKISTRWIELDYFDHACPYKIEEEAHNALNMEEWVVQRLLKAFPD